MAQHTLFSMLKQRSLRGKIPKQIQNQQILAKKQQQKNPTPDK